MKKRMHQARMKMSCVIDEVYTALFQAGGREVELRLVKEAEGLRLHVRGDYAPENRRLMERMAEMLQPAVRNSAMVEAYWELAGGDRYTSDSELSLVGQMLDGAQVRISDSQVKMELYLTF